MAIEELGFFRELKHGRQEGPSLRESLGRGAVEVRDNVADYLTGGTILAATAEDAYDVLKGERVNAGRLAIQTDGRWLWPADLAYYVREYNVELPETFISWARAADWKAPKLSTERLIEIEMELFPEPSEDFE